MKVSTINEAWNTANEIFPTDYTKNERTSAAAGYDIYESTVEGCNAWISDLGNRLEINLDNGKTISIWIEAETPAETEKTPVETVERDRKTETTITLESVTTHTTTGEETTTTREARLTLSSETALKDVAHFESEARRLIRAARAAKNRGDVVTVILSKGSYCFTDWDDLKQTRFEMWEAYGDAITADGVHLTPSEKYNDCLEHDMRITGDRGETLYELTI